MTDRHRYIIGGLFLCHGLARSGLALVILSSNPALLFSHTMLAIGLAIPSLMGAYNLLANNDSAHRIMPVAAAINLFSMPEGTAIALYYYWFWKYKCGSPNPFRAEIKTALFSAEQP